MWICTPLSRGWSPPSTAALWWSGTTPHRSPCHSSHSSHSYCYHPFTDKKSSYLSTPRSGGQACVLLILCLCVQTMVKTFEACDLPVRVAKFVARKNWILTGAVSAYCHLPGASILCCIKATIPRQFLLFSMCALKRN